MRKFVLTAKDFLPDYDPDDIRSVIYYQARKDRRYNNIWLTVSILRTEIKFLKAPDDIKKTIIDDVENVFSTRAATAYQWAWGHLQARFIKGEKAILKSPKISVLYFNKVLIPYAKLEYWPELDQKIEEHCKKQSDGKLHNKYYKEYLVKAQPADRWIVNPVEGVVYKAKIHLNSILR